MIEILGRGAVEVKGKKSAGDSLPNKLNLCGLYANRQVPLLWETCSYSSQSALGFPSKGAERQGLLIPDPERQKGLVVAGLSQLSEENAEASEPYSHDDAQGNQDA